MDTTEACASFPPFMLVTMTKTISVIFAHDSCKDCGDWANAQTKDHLPTHGRWPDKSAVQRRIAKESCL